MAFILMSSALATFFLAKTTLSLQVSSKSPCASLCLDNPSLNITDSTISNTYSSDITCVDSDYATTPTGERFVSCVTCLQNSTASDDIGSDQEWFLYNLRFAVDSCLFEFPNTTDPVSNPCSTSEACGPLKTALENGNLLLSNESEFSYCSADNSAFLGSYLSKCKTCLSNSSNEKYLGNFVTALQAGCLQQPPTGTIIGIEGNLFSTTPVTITYPGYGQTPTATSTPKHKKGLSQAAIIGISVTLAVLLMATIALLFICSRKHHNLNRMKQLKSPLDSRFGAPNITSPTNGAYGNPYSNPPVSVNEPYDPSQYSKQSSPGEMEEPGWQEAHALVSQLTPNSGVSIPTHQAYISSAPTPPYMPSAPSPPYNPSVPPPPSRPGSSGIYQMSQYPSARYSPKNVPPPLNLQQPSQTSPWQRQELTQVLPPPPARVSPQHSPPRIYPSGGPVFEYHPLFGDEGPPVIERPPSRSPAAQASPEYRPSSRTQAAQASPDHRPPSRTQTVPLPEYSPPSRAGSRVGNRPRDASRTQGFPSPESDTSRIYPPGPHSHSANVSPEYRLPSRTQTVPAPEYSPPSRAGSRAENRPRGESRSRGFPSPESESSRIYPPGRHTDLQPLETRPPSRSHSRNESWRRITGRTGIGNANASVEVPIQISGPMIKHGGRFDFELAERERMEKERVAGEQPEVKKHKKEDATPISAVSEEQWPGSY